MCRALGPDNSFLEVHGHVRSSGRTSIVVHFGAEIDISMNPKILLHNKPLSQCCEVERERVRVSVCVNDEL